MVRVGATERIVLVAQIFVAAGQQRGCLLSDTYAFLEAWQLSAVRAGPSQ